MSIKYIVGSIPAQRNVNVLKRPPMHGMRKTEEPRQPLQSDRTNHRHTNVIQQPRYSMKRPTIPGNIIVILIDCCFNVVKAGKTPMLF